MKVRCIINEINASTNPDAFNAIKHGSSRTKYPEVLIGKEYTVYGIVFKYNYPWYYLITESSDLYPIAQPKDLFEVIDSRLSRYWALGSNSIYGEPNSSIVIKEWAEDPFFYDNLVDVYGIEQDIFDYYRDLMDYEFTPSQRNTSAYPFLFKGSRPRKPLELLCTIRAIRESYVVHQFKWPY